MPGSPHPVTAIKLIDVPPVVGRIDSLHAEFELDSAYSAAFGSYREICWKRRASVTLTLDEPHPLDWLLDKAGVVQSFLSLLIGHAVGMTGISLRGAEQEIMPDVVDRTVVDVLYHRKGQPVRSPNDHPAMMLLRLPDVADALSSLLDTWCREHDRLHLPLALLWSVQQQGFAYREPEFLAITQALEALSRARDDEVYLSPKEWAPICDALIAAIPAGITNSHKVSLEARLRYGNEWSLRKRLTALLEGLPRDARDLVTGGSTGFVDEVVKERNALTHRGSQQERPFKGLELVHATLRLQLLLVLFALHAIGVEDDQLVPAARRCQYLRMVVPPNMAE